MMYREILPPHDVARMDAYLAMGAAMAASKALTRGDRKTSLLYDWVLWSMVDDMSKHSRKFICEQLGLKADARNQDIEAAFKSQSNIAAFS